MTAELRDGSRIVIRPIEPDDRAGLAQGFERLSPESRYRRFFGPVAHLSERDLDYLTRVDHRDHEALVAIEEETGEGVGVARYVRTGPDVAEPAMVVVGRLAGPGCGDPAARRAGRARARGGHPPLRGARARVQRGIDSPAREARAHDSQAARPRSRADDRPPRGGGRGSRPTAAEPVRDRRDGARPGPARAAVAAAAQSRRATRCATSSSWGRTARSMRPPRSRRRSRSPRSGTRRWMWSACSPSCCPRTPRSRRPCGRRPGRCGRGACPSTRTCAAATRRWSSPTSPPRRTRG